jgi:hypothetical protein
MFYHARKAQARSFLLILFIIILAPFYSFAAGTESHREAIVTARSKNFYKGKKTRKYLTLGGEYSSDYNSKEREFNTRYLYQSYRFIHELDFENESKYADSGSGADRKTVKKSEFYDLSLSSKARIKDSQNYGILFHRTMYDDLSKYYYDLHSAAGLGRMFFDEGLHLDLSVGYHDVKSFGHSVNFIPSFRTKFKISKNIQFMQRGYWFLDHESMDNGIRSRLSYRINEAVSLELRHNFEQRRYENDGDNESENFINRSITLGLTFRLN